MRKLKQFRQWLDSGTVLSWVTGWVIAFAIVGLLLWGFLEILLN